MSKKRKRREGAPGDELHAALANDMPPPAPSALPPALAVLGAGLCAITAVLMLVLFARALPDAAARAKEGYGRGAESACQALRPDPTNAVLGELPVAAPDFTLKDYAGRDVKLSDLKGNVVLVNFWATWCSTCVVEMPSMERLLTRMRGKPFRLLAVSVDEGWPEIRKFFAKGTPLEILLDSARTTPKLYGTEKFPESFIIDKDGTLRYYVVSNRDWGTSDVQECLDGLLQ